MNTKPRFHLFTSPLQHTFSYYCHRSDIMIDKRKRAVNPVLKASPANYSSENLREILCKTNLSTSKTTGGNRVLFTRSTHVASKTITAMVLAISRAS